MDISRGDLISTASAPPTVTDELEATLCWLADKALRPGARVLVKHGTKTTQAVIGELAARFDEQKLSSVELPESLQLNEIGQVRLRTAEPLPIDDYTVNRRTGAFLVIDASDGTTLAAGLIGAPLPVRAAASPGP
jgi:sulfate adenylyltransferase subunit 1